MAIFVIGVYDTADGRYLKLYNDKKGQVKRLKESDLIFLMDNLDIVNVEVKDGKLKGKTGSIEKVKNKDFVVILGSIKQNNTIIGYKIVDSQGQEQKVKVSDISKLFQYNIVQNASLVDGEVVRGIKWEIPVVEVLEEKRIPKGINIEYFDKFADVKENTFILDTFGRDICSTFHQMDGSLTFVISRYYLKLSEKQFYSLIDKVKDKLISVDDKNFIYYLRIEKNLAYSIDKVRKLVGNNITLQDTSVIDFGDTHYHDAPNMALHWGSPIVLKDIAGLIDGDIRDIVRQEDLYSMSILNHWKEDIAYVYHHYLEGYAKHYDISLVSYIPAIYRSRLELVSENNIIISIRRKKNNKNKTVEEKIKGHFTNIGSFNCSNFKDFGEVKELTFDLTTYSAVFYMPLANIISIYEYFTRNPNKLSDISAVAVDTRVESSKYGLYPIKFEYINKNFESFLKLLNNMSEDLNLGEIIFDISMPDDILSGTDMDENDLIGNVAGMTVKLLKVEYKDKFKNITLKGQTEAPRCHIKDKDRAL